MWVQSSWVGEVRGYSMWVQWLGVDEVGGVSE